MSGQHARAPAGFCADLALYGEQNIHALDQDLPCSTGSGRRICAAHLLNTPPRSVPACPQPSGVGGAVCARRENVAGVDRNRAHDAGAGEHGCSLRSQATDGSSALTTSVPDRMTRR